MAWQGACHENTMMLRMLMMQMLPNLLPVATCRQCPPKGVEGGYLSMKFHASGDSSPPQSLAKARRTLASRS